MSDRFVAAAAAHAAEHAISCSAWLTGAFRWVAPTDEELRAVGKMTGTISDVLCCCC
jgi:hypothetical protein